MRRLAASSLRANNFLAHELADTLFKSWNRDSAQQLVLFS